jgi:hypothetical protein
LIKFDLESFTICFTINFQTYLAIKNSGAKKVKKNLILIMLLLFTALISEGCLVSEKIYYTVKLEGPNKGIVTMQFYNIKSDANSDKEFQGDKDNLFDYMLKSNKLYVKDNLLDGKAVYKFIDINKVEGIRFEDGFYFLTLALDDSVISTNGQIIKSKEYKRILWDKSFTELKFDMYSSGFNDTTFKPLAQFYKPKE